MGVRIDEIVKTLGYVNAVPSSSLLPCFDEFDASCCRDAHSTHVSDTGQGVVVNHIIFVTALEMFLDDSRETFAGKMGFDVVDWEVQVHMFGEIVAIVSTT